MVAFDNHSDVRVLPEGFGPLESRQPGDVRHDFQNPARAVIVPNFFDGLVDPGKPRGADEARM